MNKLGRKWEVAQKADKNGGENHKMEQEWEQSGSKQAQESDKNANKVRNKPSGIKKGSKLEQEPKNGTRMRTKWDPSGKNNS